MSGRGKSCEKVRGQEGGPDSATEESGPLGEAFGLGQDRLLLSEFFFYLLANCTEKIESAVTPPWALLSCIP